MLAVVGITARSTLATARFIKASGRKGQIEPIGRTPMNVRNTSAPAVRCAQRAGIAQRAPNSSDLPFTDVRETRRVIL